MKRALLLAVVLAAWVRPLEADLPGYDDAYYARKALEVVRSGEWLALPFNGAPTFDNPPLGIWTQAIMFQLFGASDAAARFPAGLYGVLAVIMACAWAHQRFGSRETAFLCAAILLCNPLFLKYLRRGMLDMGLLFWCLAGVWLAERKPLSRTMHVLSGMAFGLAYLTKSFLALSVFAALVLGWMIGGPEGLGRLRHWVLPAVGGFTIVAGSWISAMIWLYGEAFLRGHFVWLVWEEGIRGISDTGRAETLLRVLLVLLPASAIFIAALGLALRRTSEGRYRWAELSVPLTWGFIALLTPLVVGPRKLWYFLVALPGMAAAGAAAVSIWTRERPRLELRLVKGTIVVWSLALAAVLILPLPLHRDRTEAVRALAGELRARTDESTPVSLYFPAGGCRWDVRNAFLWYADRQILSCAGERESLTRTDEASRRWILTSLDGLEQLRSGTRELLLWSSRGDLALVTLERL